MGDDHNPKKPNTWVDYAIYGTCAATAALGLASVFAAAVVIFAEPQEQCMEMSLSEDGYTLTLTGPVPCPENG